MRIDPRTMLCVSAWLAGGSVADTGIDELRELVGAAGDKVSLATGMAGWVSTLIVHGRFHEASRLASELTSLLESIGDPKLTLGLLYAALAAKYQVGELAEALRLAQRMIDLADGDPVKGNLIIGSPLAVAIMIRGYSWCCLADQRWRGEIDHAVTMVRAFNATMRATMLLFKYSVTVPNGAVLPDAAALQETAELLEMSERSGDDFTLACARYVRGLTLVDRDGHERGDGFALLAAARKSALQERSTLIATAFIDTHLAEEKARTGDLDGAIVLSRAAVEQEFVSGDVIGCGRPPPFWSKPCCAEG
jgi:adenylate cyclase